MSGTGFLFEFTTKNGVIPVIITNRHVIKDSVAGSMYFTKMNEMGHPDFGNIYAIQITDGFESLWQLHPDPNIDLCALPIAAAIRWAKADSVRLFYTLMDENSIISDINLAQIDALEDIVMIGYPNGLFDGVHYLPIARKGIIATHPQLDFNGKPEFLIDAACFPGSSGSPVFLYKPGSTLRLKHEDRTKQGNIVALLGVLYAGPQHTANGQVVFSDIPARSSFQVQIPNNLGLVIRAEKLRDFQGVLNDLSTKFSG